jgi:hypothetical protein
MAVRTVTFKRTFDGQTAAVYVYHPDTNVDEKLVFTSDRASSSLDEGVTYTLHWTIWGAPGSKLAITRKVVGVDGDYRPLLDESEIPEDDNVPAGAPVSFADSLNFSI